jgi:hypothetical protein
VSGDRAPKSGFAANKLHDQAVPNVLPAETHLAPERERDDVDNRPIRHAEPPFADALSGHATEPAAVASRLRAIAESFATRGEHIEASLLDAFQKQAAPIAAKCGDIQIKDAEDERLSLRADGFFAGKVIPDDAPTTWRALETPLDVVDFYDPSDLFGDLAEHLAKTYPSIGEPDDDNAGPGLRQLAEAFGAWTRSDRVVGGLGEADVVERFEAAAAPFARKIGAVIVKDDEDERLSLERDGFFLAEVVPEDDENSWRTLRTTDAILEFYGPAELFEALADALGKVYPETPNEDAAVAANTLFELARLWREEAFDAEAALLDAFGTASGELAGALGEFVIVDDDDERLAIGEDGQLQARVLNRSTGHWDDLTSPDQLVQSYDPVDVFEDLVDALAESFPEATRPA